MYKDVRKGLCIFLPSLLNHSNLVCILFGMPYISTSFYILSVTLLSMVLQSLATAKLLSSHCSFCVTPANMSSNTRLFSNKDSIEFYCMCPLRMKIYKWPTVCIVWRMPASLEITVQLQAVLQYCIIVQSMCSSGVSTLYGSVNKVCWFIFGFNYHHAITTSQCFHGEGKFVNTC